MTLVYALWKRRLSRPVIATTVVSLLAIWPLCWQFGILPIAYPADVNSVQPSATVRLPADVPLKVAWEATPWPSTNTPLSPISAGHTT